MLLIGPDFFRLLRSAAEWHTNVCFYAPTSASMSRSAQHLREEVGGLCTVIDSREKCFVLPLLRVIKLQKVVVVIMVSL